MAWQEQLRSASFRGVPFFVESSDATTGRRVVVHEFPLRAKPYAEDMGQKPREFSVEAFVLGADYFSARDALLRALNTEGPGELVHPYIGRLIVVCTEVSVRENTRDGGLARFALKFVETADATAPAPKVDAENKLLSSEQEVLAQAKEYIKEVWSTTGYATFVADKAVEATEAVLEQVEASQKNVRGALSEIAELSFKVRTIRSNIRRIVAAPEELAEQVEATFGMLLKAFGASEGGAKDASLFLRAFFYMPPVLQAQALAPASVPSQIQVKQNAKALGDFVRFVAISYHAEALAFREFDSAQQATEERQAALDAIDAALEDASDDLFLKLQALRVAITQAVPPPGKSLAQEIEVEVPRTAPSLLVAYETFETIENESDLIARNSIAHPGFISAGGKLKALNG